MKNVQFVVGKTVIDGHVITGESLGTAYEHTSLPLRF